MLEVMKEFQPNVLLGLSTQPKVFTKELIKEMAAQCREKHIKPIIMPMSNPTSKCECSPEEAYEWTNGEAVVATGSPFQPYTLPNGKVLIPSQCNNMYVFPGIGLAASVAGVQRITDKMLYRAAVACSDTMTDEEKAEGRTFPKISRIRDVSHKVACAVIEEAIASNLTTKITKKHIEEGIENVVARKMYFPEYHPLVAMKY
jgi:malate dehydrogenase (oxaloacetate-decarboxylating)(NADP+)